MKRKKEAGMEGIGKKLQRHAIHILDRIQTDVAELNYITSIEDADEKVKGMADLTSTLGRVIKTYSYDIAGLRGGMS